MDTSSESEESEVDVKKRVRKSDICGNRKSQRREDSADEESSETLENSTSSSEDSGTGSEDGKDEDSESDSSEDDSEEEAAAQIQEDNAARKKAASRVRQGLSVVPLVQASGEELAQLLKKLNSGGEDQSEALKIFEERARSAIEHRDIGGGTGADLIHAYFKGSPECGELLRILSKGSKSGDKVRDSGKMNAIFRLIQALLACHVVPLLLEHSRALGTKLIRKSSKPILGAIASGKPRLFTEAMRLISRASELGVVQARDAWKKFSPNIKNMARYLEVMKMEDKAHKDGPRIERPFAREARSSVIEWGIVLLRVGDPQLIAPVLGTSAFLPAAIKNIASDSPNLVDKLIQVMVDKVISNRELSFPIRAALFSSFNLENLAGLLRSSSSSSSSSLDPTSSHPRAAKSQAAASQNAAEAPQVAQAIREKVYKMLLTFSCEVLSSSSERAGAANAKLLLPLATALRPTDDALQQVLKLLVYAALSY
jgi:hypothetical protein